MDHLLNRLFFSLFYLLVHCSKKLVDPINLDLFLISTLNSIDLLIVR
jgi:hypothetical protein